MINTVESNLEVRDNMSCTTVRVAKLLATSKPLMSITAKQRRSIFCKAALTTIQYLGAPTTFCNVDFPDLVRYVADVFQKENLNSRSNIFLKYSRMKRPAISIVVHLKQASLCSSNTLFRNSYLFCTIGSSGQIQHETTEVPISYNPEWDEEFTVSIDADSSLVVQLWVKRNYRKSYCIGQTSVDVSLIRDREDAVLFLYKIDKKNEDSRPKGTVKLKCSFQKNEPEFKVEEIYRHLLLCYSVFEYQLQNDDVGLWEKFQNDGMLYHQGLSKVLNEKALTLLHQNAIQSGLTPYENVLSCFLVITDIFRNSTKIDVGVVLAVLQEMTSMGSGPQKVVDQILRDTMEYAVQNCVRHCKRILCSFPFNFRENNAEAKDELQKTAQFLAHVYKYYQKKMEEQISRTMEKGTAFTFPILSAVRDGREHPGSATALMDNVVSELVEVIDVLNSADNVFKDIGDLTFSYTALVYKNLDEDLTDLLCILMHRMDLNNISETTGHFLCRLYIEVTRIIKYIFVYHKKMELKLCDWVKKFPVAAFLAHFRYVMKNHKSWFLINKEVGNSMWHQFVNGIIEEWSKLLLIHPEPPTVAMLQVFGEQYMNAVIYLNESREKLDMSGKGENSTYVDDDVACFKKCLTVMRKEISDRGLEEIKEVSKALNELCYSMLVENLH